MSISGTNEATQSVPFGTPVATGDANAAGSAATAARSDHVHKGVVANEAWESWTPTWTNFTPGSATIVSRFLRLGRQVSFRLEVTLSSSTVSGDVSFSLPVALATYATTAPIGVVNLQDANGADYAGQIVAASGNGRILYINSSANMAALSSTAPFTWANGDQFLICGTYEAAS